MATLQCEFVKFLTGMGSILEPRLYSGVQNNGNPEKITVFDKRA